MLLADVLRRSAKFFKDRTALVCGSQRFTYGQFWKRVNRLAHGLVNLGVRKGDRIAVLLPNCHRFAEVYLAGAQLGGVVVPLNSRLSPSELAALVEHSEAVGLVTDKIFRDTLQGMAPLLPGLKFRLGTGLETEGFLDYEGLIEASQDAAERTEIEETEVAIQMYTSGTAGHPKGVLLTHQNILANTLTGIYERRFSSKDVFLNASPMYHIADFEYFFQIISVGGTNVFLNQFDPHHFLETVSGEKVTCTWLVPTMIHTLLQIPRLEQYNLRSLRCLYYGGACLPPELFLRAQSAFLCEFSLGFGLTEASPLISILRPEDHQGEWTAVKARLRSCGREAFNVEVRIVDEHDQDVSPGTPGEIVARGANIMKGYWKMEEETQRTLRGGWLHTGDMAWMDEEGYIYFLDRKKDIIKSGGESIFSREVEEAIATHPSPSGNSRL